ARERARRNRLRLRTGAVLSARAPLDHVGKTRGACRRRPPCQQRTVELTLGLPASTLVRQHPIDAEASRSAREYEQRAAKDRQILEEVIVLGDDLSRRILPIAVC